MKSYNKLNDLDKEEIVRTYYNNKRLAFKDIAYYLNVSERFV